MNEKFMELADQLKWESDVSYGELMRYAELIVKECAHKLLSFASIHESMERYDVEIPEYVQGNVYGLRCGADLIKQHFGVE